MCGSEIPPDAEKEAGESIYYLHLNYECVEEHLDKLLALSIRFSPDHISVACCKFWNTLIEDDSKNDLIKLYKAE